jgi:hypothetical protein
MHYLSGVEVPQGTTVRGINSFQGTGIVSKEKQASGCG